MTSDATTATGRDTVSVRLRESLGTKVLVALGMTLAAATAVSVVVDTQITSHRVRVQAESLLTEQLGVVVQALADDRAQRLTAQRFTANRLATQGAGGALSIEDAQGAIREVQRNSGAAGVQLISSEGQLLASVGAQPDTAGLSVAAASVDGVPAIVTTSTGEPLEVLSVAVTSDVTLVVGEPFGDPLAFDLRRLVGDDVLLLVDGQIVGRTIAGEDDIDTTVLSMAEGDPPTSVETSLGSSLIGRAALGDQTAVAIITPELLQGLSRSLAGGRAITFVVLLGLALALGYVFVRRLTRPLRALASTAAAIGAGETDQQFVAAREDEIGALARTLEQMRTTLADQVDIITEQSLALRAASARLVAARDEERRRIARDLHDGIQQQLVMMRLRLSLLEEGDEHSREEIAREIDRVIQQLRETSQQIFPSILADRGLTGGLRSLASSLPIAVRLDLDPDPLDRMAPEVEAAIYFVVAEATTNAVKHSGAARVTISAVQDATTMRVAIVDDGQGFDSDPAGWGAGLHNMHDRIAALDGRATLASDGGRGTRVEASVPLSDVSRPRAAGRTGQLPHGG